MNRETVIAKYINAVENILVAFGFNIEPNKKDIAIITLKTKEFTNALRELYLSNDKDKDDKYKVIFDVISKAQFYIAKENFETNPTGTYWGVIINSLELANSHISELHFKETDYYYPFPKLENTPHYDNTKAEEQQKDELLELSTQPTDQTNESINLEVKEEYKKLKQIREEVLSDAWTNGAFAQIRYIPSKVWHQVVNYHYVGTTYYLDYPDIDFVNDTIKFPVITKGFTAFLLHHLGKPEIDIFNYYYKNCFDRYKQIESKKPGSSLRDLEAEFYPIHITTEKELIAFSEKIYPYIDKKEIELINQYIEAYFKYIEQRSNESLPYGYTKGEKLEISPEGGKLINLPPQQTETNTNKLKVKQIALIHIYEGKQITREIAEEVAAQHGYTSKYSGEGLFQDYTTFSSLANRKGRPTPCTPKKLKNKIELFESILPHLSENNKQKAIDEINILKAIFESDYQ